MKNRTFLFRGFSILIVFGLILTNSCKEEEKVEPPRITNFSPVSGKEGTIVNIAGANFATIPSDNIVRFNDTPAVVGTSNGTSLTVTVPMGVTTGKISITVGTNTSASDNDFVALPVISDFFPKVGAIGSTVVITGTGFSANATDNKVKFNNMSATVTAATNTSLTVIVPVSASTGKIAITLGENSVTSVTDFDVVVEVVTAGGPNFEQGSAVAIDGAGNTYITGTFSGTCTFGDKVLSSAGSDDIFLAKYNSRSEFVWSKQLGGTNSDYSRSIAIDNSGAIYLTGEFFNNTNLGAISLIGSGGLDGFIVKFDASGNSIWAKSFGGGGNDGGNSVKVDGLGTPFITGYFSSTATFGSISLSSSGGTDVFVAKYSVTNGEVIWAKKYGAANDQVGTSLDITSSGNVYLSGSFFEEIVFGATILASAGGLDGFITKLNSSGDVVWAKQISGTGWENILSIVSDNNENCYLAGYFSSTISVGPSQLEYFGNEDILVAKYSSSGNLLWAKSAGSANDVDNATSITLDKNGNSYLTGFFSRNAKFGDQTLASNNNSRDIFAAKYGAEGNLLWVRQSGGAESDFGNSVAVDASNTVSVFGNVRGPGTALFGTTTISGKGNDDVFLWKIRQ
jgi:hypothetical protein